MTSPFHSDASSPYGCHNRKPFAEWLWMQDGWQDAELRSEGEQGPAVITTRVPRMVRVPFRNRRDCDYTTTELGQADKRCHGCKWRKEGNGTDRA